MTCGRILVAAAAVVWGTAVAAVPPPVPVAPIVTVPGGESGLALEVQSLLRTLGTTGYFALQAPSASPAAFEPCWKGHAAFDRCVARRLAGVATADVLVAVDSPKWRSAALRMRCIGPDAARSQEIAVHLNDAAANNVATMTERQKIAGCIIGALHGPPRAAD